MWAPIPGYSFYDAHPDGRVRSWRKKPRTWRHPEKNPGRRDAPIMLSPYPNTNGYPACRMLHDSGIRKNPTIHRLIALTFVPNPEGHTDVGHLNGNPMDSRAANLKWMSKSENLGMMKEHGTQFVACKLTPEKVKAIREQHSAGTKQSVLARTYGVDPSTISEIVNYKLWKQDWR